MVERNMSFRGAGWKEGETVFPVMDPSDTADPCAVPVMARFDSQPWGTYDDTETGFRRGTIFPALDLPFIGEGACRYERA